MALGYIGQEKNYVYIDGQPLFDVQSVDSSISTNRTVLNIAGIGAGPQVAEGVSQATLNLSRYVISDTAEDKFADFNIYNDGFHGVWQHTDSTGGNKFFAMSTGYVASYTFNAAVNSVPSTNMALVAYGSGIGQLSGIATGYMTGASSAAFLENYVYPKGLTLRTDVVNEISGIVTTNRVQSFDISFTMNREVRNRLGQMKQMPETFISYPFEATLSIDIDVDEYSIPAINSLICQDPENIFLDMKRCDGSVIRSFTFSSGVLQGASMNEAVTEINTATLEYTRTVSSLSDMNFWG
tara:strand:- start:1068 stop:1955 length:888 start_codon:yes stop_codon:yes gene_type:complete